VLDNSLRCLNKHPSACVRKLDVKSKVFEGSRKGHTRDINAVEARRIHVSPYRVVETRNVDLF